MLTGGVSWWYSVNPMIDARFVPIEKWPGKPRSSYSQKRAVFRAKYSARLDLLEKELNNLGGKDIIIQAYFDLRDIRNDGWPRSSARPKSSGVIVTFRNRKNEQLSFPCDTYSGWEDNLYAIALSLEALRTVDRYGVTQNAEQYQGWKRLAPPAQEQSKDVEWALAHLARLAGTTAQSLRLDPFAVDLAYRAAAKMTHPDKGGTAEAFHLVQEAFNIAKGAR